MKRVCKWWVWALEEKSKEGRGTEGDSGRKRKKDWKEERECLTEVGLWECFMIWDKKRIENRIKKMCKWRVWVRRENNGTEGDLRRGRERVERQKRYGRAWQKEVGHGKKVPWSHDGRGKKRERWRNCAKGIVWDVERKKKEGRKERQVQGRIEGGMIVDRSTV